MATRKLASIQKIRNLEPIEGADRIELATINSWKVVVAKDVGHKIGDFVVYFEIDSFLPIRPEFEFLRKTSYKKMGDEEGFRLRTIRMRKQISQGLITPISILEGPDEYKIGISHQPHGDVLQIGPYDDALIITEGVDVTEILGIQKYEAPIPAQLEGIMKGSFPSWGRKTDQERCMSAETLILTENGNMTIQEICENKLFVKVLSYNTLNDEDEFQNITSHSIMNTNKNWYEIELNDGSVIKLTGNHLVWLDELLCYREVDKLKVGDLLKKTD